MILNLITLRLEKSVFYLSKILAFNKFSKFIKNK